MKGVYCIDKEIMQVVEDYRVPRGRLCHSHFSQGKKDKDDKQLPNDIGTLCRMNMVLQFS